MTRETEGRWRALMEHWPGSILTIDGTDRLTSISRSIGRVDAEGNLGRDLFDFVAPQQQVDLRADLAAIRAGRETFSRHTHTSLVDGTRRWYDSCLILLPEGGVMIIATDVTQGEETKVALQHSEQRHRALVENTHDAISLMGADGTTLYVSPAVERISGHAPSELVGRNPFDSVHPDDRERVASVFTHICATPCQPVTFEYRARHRDGSYRWIEATGTNLLGDPSVAAIVSNFRDVTGRRELVEERRRAADARLSQERLRVLARATQAFSEASRSPERLFEVVVHELAETLGCACTLSVITEDGAHFTTAHVHASDPDFLVAMRAHVVASGPRRIDAHPGMRHVVETRTPFFMRHVDAETDAIASLAAPDVVRFALGEDIQSALVVPLSMRGQVVGALGLTRQGGHGPALDEQDLALVQTLAEHAALALTAARLLVESERELTLRERMAARLRFLADASQDFSEATGDYARLLGVIARRLGELMDDLCSVRAVSEDGILLEAGATHHRDPEIAAWAQGLLKAHSQRVGEGTMGRVAATGQPIFIASISTANYAATTEPRYREILERLRVGSVIIVPMLCRGKVVGVVSLLRSGSDHPYTEDDLNLVRNVADHAALAIANARSYAAERLARAAAVKASEALHESEVAHRLLFDASPIPLIVFDVETLDFLAVNAAALRLYGYSRDEFLGMKLSEMRLDGEGDSVKATVAAMGEAEASGMVRHRRKTGPHFFAEYQSRAILFGGRRARFTVITDVTARRDAEEMRALLGAIVQSSNDAIVSKRLDGSITSWNGAAQRLFGFSALEAVGEPIALVIPPDRLDEERTLLERVGAGQHVDHYETIRRRKDGSEVAVSISLAPIRDASGRVVGASKTARDLTVQRQAESALRSAEEQLRQSQKMEAIGRLAGGIAHDFNNVLTVILSYSEMILGEVKANDPIRGDLDEIHTAGLRAADLTRQLLMFSRQQVVAPKVLDLNGVLVDMDRMVRRIVGEDVDLVSTPAPGLGRVLADASNVEQIIMNLVVNARDAMPTGGKLTIETANVELGGDYAREHLGVTPGPHVMLAVSDTGVGMSPATQARIFEPFFTTKEVGKGTGLGLSTVFGIVQQSGGTVWVYSEPGAGTTFKVYFPRVEADVDAASPAPAPVMLRGSETILLVEDQEQVRAVAHDILKRYGYRVLVAQNAGDALLLSKEHSGIIHLLLTDVVMPEMSGSQLAARIALARPETKVLFMSGYTDDSVVRHGVLASGVAFLQKPFTPESLTRKLRQVLQQSATAPGVALS